MSKKRSIKRQGKFVPTEDLLKLAGMSQLMLSVYKLPNGELFSQGFPMSEDDEMLVSFFILERFAQFRNMTVEEYVFRIMRKYDEDKQKVKTEI